MKETSKCSDEIKVESKLIEGSRVNAYTSDGKCYVVRDAHPPCLEK